MRSGCVRRRCITTFATKDDILDALLAGTVDDPLQLARELLAGSEPAAPRLHVLIVSDVTQLCGNRWNLGALYLLPEVRLERFEEFRLRAKSCGSVIGSWPAVSSPSATGRSMPTICRSGWSNR